MLLTIDGVFQQRYLATPNENWTWQKFDMFVLGMISNLIGDEFHDGEISSREDVKSVPAYTELKRCRQAVKDFANRREIPNLIEREDASRRARINPFFEVFRPCLTEYLDIRDRYTEIRVRGILSQTRGAGTPPPLVAIQTKIDLILTTSKEPIPLPKADRYLLERCFKEMIDEVPDSAFTGLRTKAGIRAATASCFEKTRSEGGSAQAIQDIVYEGVLGRTCKILNLEDGRETGVKILEDCTPGEYIFWRCLEEVLTTDLDELRKVFMLVVSEPGKARSVTKGAVALKVVLDVVNAICSWPLQKGFKSSQSGMSKEAHGWNFFRSFGKEGYEEVMFSEESLLTEHIDPVTRKVTKVYRDAYCLSTDFKTATDFLEHQVAEIPATLWMRKCGIPKVLVGIVSATCYRPRKVRFTAIGVMTDFGVPVDGIENVHEYILRRGVLMGDPLTKVVLHLINIGIRYLSWKVNDVNWLSKICTNPQRIVGEVLTPSTGKFHPVQRRSV
jgi:hypothetical protein